MKKFKLEANELLQRNELKTVFGGYEDEGSGSCTASCEHGDPVNCNGDNCNANDNSGCSSTEETHACPSA